MITSRRRVYCWFSDDLPWLVTNSFLLNAHDLRTPSERRQPVYDTTMSWNYAEIAQRDQIAELKKQLAVNGSRS